MLDVKDVKKIVSRLRTEIDSRGRGAQKEIAKATGINPSTLNRALNAGTGGPTFICVVNTATALGFSIDTLIRDAEGAKPVGEFAIKETLILSALRDAAKEMGPAVYDVTLKDIGNTKSKFMSLTGLTVKASAAPDPDNSHTKALDEFARNVSSGSAFDPVTQQFMPRRRIVLPNRAPRRVNRRDEIPALTISRRASASAAKLPLWYSAACGHGRELERSPDYLYFRELPDWRGVHSVVVQGESMCDTLIPKDIVLLQEIGDGGLALSEIESEDQKTTLMIFKRHIAHDDICLLSINDEEPTLKRVKIQPGNNGTDWTLLIAADNPAEWEPRSITRKTAIRFYAKLIGRAKREGE